MSKFCLLPLPTLFGIFSLIILQSPLFAQESPTYVSGTINSNTSWDLTGSPYVVTNNLTVVEGTTLTIEPGVVIKHDGSDFLDIMVVNGTLIAQGTPSQPIIFTDIADDLYGGDTNDNGAATSPHPGDWLGIHIQATSAGTSILEYCHFRYGGRKGLGQAAVRISGAAPTINQCTFYSCEKGLTVSRGGSPIISNNTFDNNSSVPISISLTANPSFSNNSYSNNARNGLGIEAFNYNSAGASYTLNKTSIAGIGNIPYIINLNDLMIAEGVTLTIDPGVIIKHDYFDFYDMITVEGTLIAEGTPDEPIIFTDISDDAFGGDTNNNGDATSPHPGDWIGINFKASSGNSSILRHCTFRFGGDGGLGQAAVRTSGASPTVDQCTFYQCEKGMSLTGGGTPTISNNIFESNSSTPISISLSTNPNFSSNTLSNNARNGIGIETFNYSATGASYTLRQTNVAGISNIPYIINLNDLKIAEGVTLTIEPGVVIKHDYFDFYDMMTIEGTLIAQGTASEPIIFTDISDDAFGGDTNNNGDATSPHPGDWIGINFKASSGNSSILKHCQFRFGGESGLSNAAVRIIGASPTIEQCTFFQCEKGLTVTNGGSPVITNNTFERNTSTPINISLTANPTFSGNTLLNNPRNGIGIEAFNYNATGSTYTLPKTEVGGFTAISYIINDDDLKIAEGVTLRIEPGVVIKHDFFDFSDMMTIEGTLIAQGTTDEPIIFTDIADDTFGGDTNNNGDATSPHAGDWLGINIRASSGNTSILQHCQFRFGGDSGLADAAVRITGASPTVEQCTFFQCEKGLTVTNGGSPLIADNTFESNTSTPINISLTANPNFSGNTLLNNARNGIGIEAFNYNATGSTYTLPKTDIAGINNVSYIINDDDLKIAEGVTLKIEPGVVIKHDFFDFVDMMTIDGTLIAQGTAEEPIIFTDISDDEFGGDTNNNGDATSPHSGDWQGIKITSTSENTSILEYCTFRFGGDADLATAAVEVLGASPRISNNKFSRCEKGIAITAAGTPTIEDNEFIENTSTPVSLSLSAAPVFSGNIITENPIKGIGIEAFDYDNDGASYRLSKRNFGGINNISYVINHENLTIGTGVTLTIDAGVVIKHDFFDGIDMMTIQGQLIAEGTANAPIAFTDISDDEFGGDTNNNGDGSSPHIADWGSVTIANGAYAKLSNCHFRFGGRLNRDKGALTISDSIDITRSEFYQNAVGLFVQNSGIAHVDSSSFLDNTRGIKKTGGNFTIKHSNLVDNSAFAIENTTTDTIDAQLNWWGAPSGPYHTTNEEGQGNPVSDYVLFDPFLLQDVEPTDTTVSSGCPDFDIILLDQSDVDSFIQQYSTLCDSIFGSLVISRNVTDISGLNFLTYIGGNLRISDNDKLTDYSGLGQLTVIEGQLYLANNDAITNLQWLSNIVRIGQGITIRSNTNLSDCETICSLLNAGQVSGNLFIADNAGDCNSLEDIQGACTDDGEPPMLSIVGLPNSIEEGGLLSFEIVINYPTGEELLVNLVSSSPIDVPLSSPVSIPANGSSVQLSLQLPNDDLPELDKQISITAAALNYASTSQSFLLTDATDMPEIELILTNDTISESAGLYAAQGVIRRSGANINSVLTIDLKVDQTGQLYLPSRLSLAPGQTEAEFTIGVLDNSTVDGNRNLVLSAAAFLPSCNCLAPLGSLGRSTANLQIIDNDGPSLSLFANPLALEEGAAEPGILEIKRNTPPDTDLTVTLRSSDVSEIELPLNVIIPQGATAIEIPISAKADGISDGNQQVTIEASAPGFAPGIIWVITSDINKPDLQIVDVSVENTNLPSASAFSFSVSLINTGFATAARDIPLVGYLSEDAQIDNSDHIIGEYLTNQPLGAGDTLQFLGVGTAPLQPRKYNLLFRVNAQQDFTEVLYFNNTSEAVEVDVIPSYFGSATVDEDKFVQGEEIIIYGSSFNADQIPIPNAELDILINTGEIQRIIPVQTNSTANYSFVFEPLPTEAGPYQVRANFPGQNGTEAQDSFDILGIEINGGLPFKWELLLNETVDSTVEIRNLTSTTLNNLVISPIALPNGCSLTFEPVPVLGSKASALLSYEITGSVLTPRDEDQEVYVLISTDEGVAQEWKSDYLCQELGAHLTASISSINSAFSQNGVSVFEFQLYNIGLGGTGDITVEIPEVSWMGLSSAKIMPSLAPGDTSFVILQWIPTEDLPLNTPATGQLVITTTNGNSLTVPFSLEKVSEERGNVLVDVIDEYTYFTEEAPHVAGAQVKISHYFTGEVFAQGITNEEGLFLAEDLPEGLLRVTVQAESHDNYDGIVHVRPGQTEKKVVFISYRAVSFSWDVVPTTIEDDYQVDLIMEFETNVPVPVVTMDFPDTLPQLFGNDTYPFFITLTNHGLIAAREVELNFPDDDEFEFITNYTPQDIPALSAIQIPVVMKVRNEEGYQSPDTPALTFESISRKLDMDLDLYSKDFLSGGAGGCAFVFVVYFYECGENGVYRSTGDKLTIRGRPQDCGGGGWIPEGGGGGAFGLIGGTSSYSGCNPCLNNLGETIISCISLHPAINIPFKCLVKQDPISCACAIVGGIPCKTYKYAKCVLNITNLAMECGWIPSFDEYADSDYPISERSPTFSFPVELQQSMDDIYMYGQAYEAISAIGEIYYGPLADNENLIEFANTVDPFVTNVETINTEDRSSILNQMEGYDISTGEINDFIERWNTTVEAWNAGIFSPNETYPTIIDKNLSDAYYDQIERTVDYAAQRGFPDSEIMLTTAMEEAYDLTQTIAAEDASRTTSSVCASVTINISQQVSMTREAFDGTLTVYNGHPELPLENINLNLEILDENGVPSNDLFEIETSQLIRLTGIDGQGTLAADQDGTARILFIPERAAAPEVPTSYSFGGTISYLDPFSGTQVTLPLLPVTLQVNPSPDLFLRYFMQRDIYGDDPLTDPVEPILPADLAVMVENNGFGVAQKVLIESAQPEIIDNEKGLAIHFKLIGSNLQGEPASLGLTSIDFGNIEPLQTKIGQWYFTSDLLGHFINYRTELVHLDSRGNPDLSLISGSQLHELIRTIEVYGSAEDSIDDFLVNDIPDPDDLPDAIYLSQGNLVYDVFEADTASFVGDITLPDFSIELEVDPARIGWNYVQLEDPGAGNFELVSVTRSDGQVIPLKNVWLTHVTIPDRTTPVYEDKFHLVDNFTDFAPISYTVVWKAKNPDPVRVVSITGYPQEVTSEQVKELQVTFNKPIDTTSFTHEDLMMQLQGGGNIIDETVIITQIDDQTFNLDISSLTTGNGYYLFTVQAANIKDVTGALGEVGEQISWTQFLSAPVVKSFGGIPENRISSVYDSIQLLFNLPIDAGTLVPERFSILQDGIALEGTFTINSLNAESTLFELIGLGSFMDQDGDYDLIIDLPMIQTIEGVNGLVEQSITLTLDSKGPDLVNLIQGREGALDDQHYTLINLNFSEPVQLIDLEAIELRKNGVLQDLSNTVIEAINEDWIQVNEFDILTFPEGNYTFSIDLSKVKDLADNRGAGVESLTWTVNRTTALSISNVTVSPDLGFSAVDGITAARTLDITFEIDAPADDIQLYQNDNGSLSLLGTIDSAAIGQVVFNDVLFPSTGQTSLQVQLKDKEGNPVQASKALFLDETNLFAEWDLPANQELREHPSSLVLSFSEPVLDEGTISTASIQLNRGSDIIDTDGWALQRLTDTSYQLIGLTELAPVPGSYQLKVDLSAFQKYSSGVRGTGGAIFNWELIEYNQAPIAEAGPDTLITIPQVYQLDGSGSFDPDDNVLTYQWFPPATIQLDDAYAIRPSFEITAADDEQNYRFLLSVSDGQQISTDEVTVSVMLQDTITSAPILEDVSKRLQLQIFPNPFVHQTSVEYYLPEAGTVSLLINDLRGRMVHQLQRGIKQKAGWHRLSLNLPQLESGIYLLVLQSDHALITEKLLLGNKP